MKCKLGNRQQINRLFVFAVLLLTAFLTACNSSVPSSSTQSPVAASKGTISSSLPAEIDPQGRYLFYLHGRIIEDEGVDAVSSEFGPYEYTDILDYFAEAGFNVVSQARAPQTDAIAYSDIVVAQVETLLAVGVPAGNISIVGFSKGGAITIYASSRLENPELNFVLMAICGDWIYQDSGIRLNGRVLSLYESSDPLGGTCRPVIERSPEVSAFEEIELNTGKQHGAFYAADPSWQDPIVAWLVP